MDRGRQGDGHPAIEWIFGGLSAVIVAAMTGYLTFQAVAGNDRPARIEVAVERPDATEGGKVVSVTVRNTGDRAAADVAVEARSGTGVETLVWGELRFDLIGPGSSRQGNLILDAVDAPADLRVVVTGHVDP